jgi:glycosyltransferase involved in cell wall biosynthesis
MKRVCFIYRKHADTPSIERVFQIVSGELEAAGIEVLHARLPFGNSVPGVVGNLLFFRSPKADAFHITGHFHYLALRLPRKKTVLTVHDLGILRTRSGIRKKIIKKLFFDWPVRKLRFVTAVSESTKRAIVRATQCKPGKIVVINDPVDPAMKGEHKQFNSDKPTILQVGTAPHKNLENLIEAIRGLSCQLKVVGKLNGPVLEHIKRSDIEFECLNPETDEEMRAVYANCDLVAFCSTFEGFGLPIIEAQSMGIPLITSVLAPMNEIAADGAILVDPFDPSDIRRAIETIIADPVVRNDIVTRGKANVRRFDPTKIAREYIELYESIEAKS